jgi:FkbM family methyltransferase
MSFGNFTVIESVYGLFIVNRYCAYQAEALVKTGRPHIEAELQHILKLVDTLPQNCVIVDAGANIGLISIPVAHAVAKKSGIVHAFEVQRMMSYALCGAAALNDLENLHVHRRGLGAARAVLKVPRVNYGVAQDFGMVSLVKQAEITVFESVEIVTVDELGLPRLDFLKVDVEGMEIDVLRGARRTMEAHQPWGWIEHWKVDPRTIKQQFAGLNYKFFEADKLNMLCAPVARLAKDGIKIDAPEIV